MILEVDYGNTRLKWRVLSADLAQPVAAGSSLNVQALMADLQGAGYETLSFVRACSVRSSAENNELAAVIEASYGRAVVYAQTQASQSGVSNAYAEPTRLGVDRWLAMLGAYTQIKGACLVIDCGTAITADYIKADGTHLGGCIAPGLQLMAKGLLAGTHMPVRMQGVTDEGAYCLGRTTEQAIRSGIKAMGVGFVREQLRIAEDQLGNDFVVIASGGDSELVSAVSVDALIQKDLVFSGLAIACPQVI